MTTGFPSEMRAQLKTCHLGTPADLLDMLVWQFKDLQATDPSQLRAIDYKTMQCAVTAWQISDWVFEDLPTPLRDAWQFQAGKSKDPLVNFQNWVRAQSPSLRICHVIANAFKHRTLRNDPAPDVTSDTMNRLTETMQLSVRLVFTHDGFVLDPADVVRGAIEFWADRLRDASLTERSTESVRFASLEADPSGWGRGAGKLESYGDKE